MFTSTEASGKLGGKVSRWVDESGEHRRVDQPDFPTTLSPADGLLVAN
jgi:hypothetical protein